MNVAEIFHVVQLLESNCLFVLLIKRNLYIYLFIRFYLFIHEKHTEREAEGEAGSMQRA